MDLSQGPTPLSHFKWNTSSRKPSGAWHYISCPCNMHRYHPVPPQSQAWHSHTPALTQPSTYPTTALHLPCHSPASAQPQPHTCPTTILPTCTSMASVPAHFPISLRDSWRLILCLFLSPLNPLKTVGFNKYSWNYYKPTPYQLTN